MPYTDSSGVQIPVGTDAFNPTSQFKTWQDGNATYNNRVVVLLDSDRTTLATPVLRAGLECYVESTDKVWTYDGTSWHNADLTNMQMDTTNSEVRTRMQYGFGKIVGNNTLDISEAITFPTPFGGVPSVVASFIGFRTAGQPFNGASALSGGASAIAVSTQIPSATGVTIGFRGVVNLSSTLDWYYTWQAVGPA